MSDTWNLYGKLDGDGYAVHPPVNVPPVYNVNRNAAWLAEHGYELHEASWWTEHAQPVPQRTRCTKYQLVTCLRVHFPAMLESLRTAYASNAELQFFWNTVQELDRNNADFRSAARQLGITDAQLDEIFSKIEDEEPEQVTE